MKINHYRKLRFGISYISVLFNELNYELKKSNTFVLEWKVIGENPYVKAFDGTNESTI